MVVDLVYYNNPDVCLCTYIIEIKQSDHIQGDIVIKGPDTTSKWQTSRFIILQVGVNRGKQWQVSDDTVTSLFFQAPLNSNSLFLHRFCWGIRCKRDHRGRITEDAQGNGPYINTS